MSSACIACLFGLLPASVTVSAQLSAPSAEVGDVVNLTVRAVATIQGNVRIELPPLDGISVVGRRESTQMSMSFGGGGSTVRREKTLQVELSIDAPGNKTIPPIVAIAGNQRGQSPPLQLRVGVPKPVAPSAAEAGKVVPPDATEQSLFVRYRVDRSSAWLGQQILVDFDVFVTPGTRLEVESIDEPPDLDGFWKELISNEARPTKRFETVGGQRYEVYQIWRVALFPVKAGEHVLPSVQATFRVGGRSLFAVERARRKSRPLTLQVKPLPKPAPSGFSSANVGNFALTAQVDRRLVEDGRAIVLKVSLSGTGHIKGIRLPSLDQLEGFRVFPPTQTEDVDLRPAGVHGTKQSETLLVPTRNGELTIPSLSLALFDPLEGAYRTLRTDPMKITVRKVAEQPASTPPSPSNPQPADVPETETSRPIRLEGSLEKPPEAPHQSSWWWILLALGPVGLGAAQLAGRLQRLAAPSEAKKQRRSSQARMQALLAEGGRAAASGDASGVASAFLELCAERANSAFGLEIRGITTSEAVRQLEAKGLAAEVAKELSQALEQANFLRYGSGLSDALPETWTQWRSLAELIENQGRSP